MQIHRSVWSCALAGITYCVAPLSAQAADAAEKVVHAFAGGSDGMLPGAGLIADAEGNFYGVTKEGGGGCSGNSGCGAVFKIAAGGPESTLYAFKGGSDGQVPEGPLFLDGSGNLYGTTSGGGGTDCLGGFGCGTIYRLAANGTETVLYAFQGESDGWNPMSGLVIDANNNLYGTTADGGEFGSNCGSYGCGTVFELQPNGNLITLHAFQGASDGEGPSGGVVMDSAGNLYGTAQGGSGTNCNGAGCGVVFEISSGGAYTVLYTFQGGSDGDGPLADLIADESGNLYGTTEVGGDPDCASGEGCGSVFEVPAGGGSDKVLYSFHGGSDGADPIASVVRDAKGNFYGTTEVGGGSGNGCKHVLFGDGCGTVFKLTPSGKETILYHFFGRSGQLPMAPVMLGKNGALYGTTTAGGKHKDGVVFEVKK